MAKPNVKQLLIEHVEKAVFGLAALTGLGMTVASNWKPYEGTPGEITKSVSEGSEKFKSNKWPKEQRELYADQEKVTPSEQITEKLFRRWTPDDAIIGGKSANVVFKRKSRSGSLSYWLFWI